MGAKFSNAPSTSVEKKKNPKEHHVSGSRSSPLNVTVPAAVPTPIPEINAGQSGPPVGVTVGSQVNAPALLF